MFRCRSTNLVDGELPENLEAFSMYQSPQFKEDRLEVMHDLMRAHPLATLVSFDGDGMSANHLPLVLHTDVSERGTLRGHVAKTNPL